MLYLLPAAVRAGSHVLYKKAFCDLPFDFYTYVSWYEKPLEIFQTRKQDDKVTPLPEFIRDLLLVD